MFGASEDRARQLAGRQRWKRIGSGASNSSYRSASSSSQLSQTSHIETSFIFEQSFVRPSPIPEHPACIDFGSLDSLHDFGGLLQLLQPISVSDIEDALSQTMAKNLHPRMLQQRSQTEYLTRVLYDDTALDDAFPPPSSRFAIPNPTKQYGVLGWGAKILRQVRHVTEPASHPRTEDHLPNVVTAHDLTSRSISVNLTSAQPNVSIRGGAGPEPPIPWMVVQDHFMWDHMYNTGPKYRRFMEAMLQMSPVRTASFVALFDDSRGPEANPARQQLMIKFSAAFRGLVRIILEERAKLILGSALYGETQHPLELEEILATSCLDDGFPAIKPRNLFLAFVYSTG